MELILWRHADAEPGADDQQRPLTEKGKRQAERVARWLSPRIDADWKVLASPTLRTRQTADALGVKYDTRITLGTDSTVHTILREAHWPDGPRNVIVVGHQPVLGQIAARLLTGQAGEMAFRKGSVWWFSTKQAEEGDASTVLRVVVGADLVEAD